MRGEYLYRGQGLTGRQGTTSACAENTRSNAHSRPGIRNYLRVRGEYSRGSGRAILSLELPPRARRIQVLLIRGHIPPGTTSACAENTAGKGGRRSAGGNYLRVRGEYREQPHLRTVTTELPPRARRIRFEVLYEDSPAGTTSACAENTESKCWKRINACELPPRARRIHPTSGDSDFLDGTTSACAENTPCHP